MYVHRIPEEGDLGGFGRESLYSLCMNCLPSRPFPISSSTPFPITFPLPVSRADDRRQTRSHGKKNRSNYECAFPLRRESPLSSVSRNKRQVKIESSTDDDGGDDEDEELFQVTTSYAEDDASLDDSCSPRPGPSSTSILSGPSTDYAHYFAEFTQSTASTTTVPGKSDIDKFADLVLKAVKKTKSVACFVKIPYPATIFPANLRSILQPLAKADSSRNLLAQQVAHLQNETTFTPRIVYDLDHLITSKSHLNSSSKATTNDDPNRIGKLDESRDHLLFESRFEGGNLRRATQVGKLHYELILSPDINQMRPHYQWFYFEVFNNKAGIDYTFEIINCFKKMSMFSRGMQPVLFSVTEACSGNFHWVRTGSSICYSRNSYSSGDSSESSDTTSARYHFSLRFTIRFEHSADVCYIAYHFPYTYSMLQATLERYLTKNHGELYVRSDELCKSLAGNSVSLLTITALGTKKQLVERQIIVLCARVHPGESNSSWIMHGIMDYLMSDKKEAMELRNQFVFKLIPMLNVDGVVNGSHRCSLAGVDLNRTWHRPSPVLHPIIYHCKALVQHMVDVLEKKPFVFIDLHGHSKRFNVFLFGNNPDESWRITDHSLPKVNDFMSLPSLLQNSCDYFSLSNCRFSITKSKESSGRVAIWRQYDVTRSYTIESTYCGFDCGPLKGYQVNIEHLMRMGEQLCEALNRLKYHNSCSEQWDEEELD